MIHLIEKIKLREFRHTDLKILFEQQTDKEAYYMAAFTVKDPTDWKAFEAYWEKVLVQKDTLIRIITADDRVVGYVSKYMLLEQPHIGYWIDKREWGKGIASTALKEFLNIVKERPVQARVAYDNAGSIKVLNKSGFNKIGEDKYFANSRSEEIKEYIFELNDRVIFH